MKKILLTGGSGLVGQALTRALLQKGYEVAWLSRNARKGDIVPTFLWNWEKGMIDPKAFDGVTHIVHLAGANIASHRWTNSYKKKIADSRIETTKLLLEKVKKYDVSLESFVASSAIGYYGTFTSDETLTETSLKGNDFLAEVCEKWENASLQFANELNIRTVCLRTGIVLAKEGGAFPKMLQPTSWGLGSVVGNGKQYMPWIHINDLVAIYVRALEDTTMHGAYNATAPEPTTNKDFTQNLAKALHTKIYLPNVPAFVLKLFLGKRADLLTKGTFVAPKKLQIEGFQHKYECPALAGGHHYRSAPLPVRLSRRRGTGVEGLHGGTRGVCCGGAALHQWLQRGSLSFGVPLFRKDRCGASADLRRVPACP